MNQYIFHRNALPYLPKDDVNWQFKRCAIVSNSGELLSSNYGPEIGAPPVTRCAYCVREASC